MDVFNTFVYEWRAFCHIDCAWWGATHYVDTAMEHGFCNFWQDIPSHSIKSMAVHPGLWVDLV